MEHFFAVRSDLSSAAVQRSARERISISRESCLERRSWSVEIESVADDDAAVGVPRSRELVVAVG